MAEVVGLENALRICSRVGGTRVYIPQAGRGKRFPSDHWLAETIGQDSAFKFAEVFQGDLCVPKGPIELYVQALAAQGHSVRKIATELRVTERTIRRARARIRKLTLPQIDFTPAATGQARVFALLGLTAADVERYAEAAG
jgi:hypothetical protein